VVPASEIGPDCLRFRVPVLTAIALLAFASNSLLCRWALGASMIDAAGFTSLRLASGAILLGLITTARPRKRPVVGGSFASAALLFAYAVTFSFAFIWLHTGTGALILFASVQATMFTASFIKGKKPSLRESLGLLTALAGLGYLVFPGLNAPSPWAAGLMMLAGMAWSGYTLRGHHSANPVYDTAGNFLRTLPLVLLIGLVTHAAMRFSPTGVLLATLSGIASASGYIVWYAALQHLNAKHAALVQLSVPLLAAAGGVMFLSEPMVSRMIIAAALILGGIALAIAPLRRSSPTQFKRINIVDK